ncbi:fc25bc29-8394-4f21-80a7-0b2bc49dcfc1 [Thermothielavioides terrestris]|uniref:Fc25bc29-8394-4f21-80a7-0b2bc49dcfc1 n=1 Tax=Thermothielavioides terrestris TaxID=2587410 RepID=A0A446BH90_9PEZI|nr:fc25bc29-8394-4f21-80a7-0b2bc49dcfc1 [Thermothielavioides terrestris]
MPPKEKTTNFKTWETQARLLAAVVASLGENFRFDYKTIAKYFARDTTESAIEHRFRAIKVQAAAAKEAVEKNVDPMEVNLTSIKTRDEIRDLFGASTEGGIGFQFREIKQGAKVLTKAVQSGEDPVAAFSSHLSGGTGATTTAPTTPSTTKRARSTKRTASGSGATPATKRRKAAVKPEPEFDDDEDSPEVDYEELDLTPTKEKKKWRPHAGQLLPPEAWRKPPPGTKGPRSSFSQVRTQVRIAPAPPRPATPAYTLAPIPGTTNQPIAGGYANYPAFATGSSVPSVANSPAVNMDTTRRDSAAFSVGSGSSFAGSPPPEAFMSHVNPHQTSGMMVNTSQYSPVPDSSATIGMGNVQSFHGFDAASPSASVSEAHTPQSTTSSYTMMAAGPATTAHPSFYTAQGQYSPTAQTYTDPGLEPQGDYVYPSPPKPRDDAKSQTYGSDQAPPFAGDFDDFSNWSNLHGYDDAGDC